MATDFTKDVESAISDVKNFGKTLNNISKAYQKSLDEIGKKSNSIPKSWGEITQKLKDSVTPSGTLAKNISDINKKIEAGKIKQSSLTSEIQKNAEKRRTIESTINKIGDESTQIINNAVKSGRKLNVGEIDRLKILSNNESKLKTASVQLLNQQKILGQQLKSERDKNVQLSSQLNMLKIISVTYDTIKNAILSSIKIAEIYDKILMEFAHNLGVGRIEAEKYVPALTKSAQQSKALGASLKDSTAAATQLVNQFELMAVSALEDVNYQMLVLNKAFGVSLEDSAKFYATLTQVGNTSLSSQTNMTGIADAAAKAAGVPLGRVIKDVANISDGVRLIFKGNTEQLIKQAAEARKLGTSLDSAAKSAESLLNFESSIGSELKLSALLGKNVNFNESRRLYFAGKTVEAEKAILSQLNKIGDINDLNFFQRKALAELTGKSFGELQKMQAQSKQQLELDSKFPELAAERLKYEQRLKEISGSELKQKQQAEEMQARDNIANARANVFLKQKEQILINLSRAIQPFYRALTQISEVVLDIIIGVTDWMAQMSSAYPTISKWTVGIGGIVVGVLGLAAAIGTLIVAFAGLSFLGVEISAFLIEISAGIAAFGIAGLTTVPIILSIAAGIASIGVAAWGLGKLFSGLGDIIRSILDPIAKIIETVITGFNAFTTNIGLSMVNVATSLKTMVDIGFSGFVKTASGIIIMSKSLMELGSTIINFPIDKLSRFVANFKNIGNIDLTSLNKLYEIFQIASNFGGGISINIEKEVQIFVNKFSESVINFKSSITESVNFLNKTSDILEKILDKSKSIKIDIKDTSIDKITGFASNFSLLSNVDVSLLNKLYDVFEKASLFGGKITIGVEKETFTLLDKLTEITVNFKKLITDSTNSLNVASSILTKSITIDIQDEPFKLINKLNGFVENFTNITNGSISSLNKLSEFIEKTSLDNGKIMIGIEDEAAISINKLTDLKGEKEELKQTIREGNDRLVKGIENLTNLLLNGSIAVNLDGQLVSRGLANATYKSGGFGQSTTRA
jgi:hypothetical protein